jgi:intergrase/recombinase
LLSEVLDLTDQDLVRRINQLAEDKQTIEELEKAAKDLITSYNTKGLINIEDRINELEQTLSTKKI